MNCIAVNSYKMGYQFITFEGIEGSGKTTQIGMLENFYKKLGKEVCVTREPGGTVGGRLIRSLMLNPEVGGDLNPLELLALFFTDRRLHIDLQIKPALEKGERVLCDRYHDASKIYQVYAESVSLEDFLYFEEKMLHNFIEPDITFLLDLPPELGLERAGYHEFGKPDVMERRTLPFHRKVREGYLELAKKEPERIKVIDASPDEQTVFQQIMEYFD